MSTVIFKRGDMATMNATPRTDGMVFFNEENNKIYMDNGNTRYQYGGDTELISNINFATLSNAFNAQTSLDLFLQKTTVVDTKSNAFAVNQNYIPLGCLAFKETIGNADLSNIGDGTISGAIVGLKGEIIEGALIAGQTTLTLNSTTLNNNSLIQVFTSQYKVSPKDVTTSGNTITLTFIAQNTNINVRVIVKNL